MSVQAADVGLIPGSGRSPGEGHGKPLQYPCWEIPWTKQSGGLQSKGSQRVRRDRVPNTFTFFAIRIYNHEKSKLYFHIEDLKPGGVISM